MTMAPAKPTVQTESHTLPAQDQRTRCEVWTRVMGYHRPVTNFNIGKKSEHYSRQHFSESHSLNSSFCQKYA